ncbi:Spore coat polysaccharide biosynthesis protein SpsA [Geobacillus stearothermophilus]|nr:Spore coat polysaccharide biosynthesis protein SpsA [Geobacillus stearothermophilus]
MNDKKIAFIYCVNNRELYEESVRYVRSLYVPEGYKIEIITIEGAKSITSGYNEAMKKTDAKYKVYLHQDAFIVNKNFLYDIIALFEKYPKLGMIGVVGAKTIPRNGIWWESTQRFGKVYDSHTGEMKLLSFKETELEYEPVQAIDGLIMITQYDIPWREDLFTGWHFYDLSECQEFLLAGYDVGVVRQNVPWCVHDCGIASAENGFDNDRKKFVDVYGENVQRLNKTFLPLVSILIPTYNRPHYFELALQSALNQTYENIEVIVCDDSTNDEVEKMLEPYLNKYNNIRYYRNNPSLVEGNFDRCFQLARGEYINYLMDDDIFHPKKIEKMIKYFLKYKDVTLVTSYRKLIDQNGYELPDLPTTEKLFHEDTIIDGKVLGNYMLKNNINVVGEPTTVLFRKQDLSETFGHLHGRRVPMLNDLASWIALLAKGKAVYISEPLSYFRQHPSQNQKSLKYAKNAISDWIYLIMHSRKKGFLSLEDDYKTALNNVLKTINYIFQLYINESKTDLINYKELQSQFEILIKEIITHQDKYCCNYCNKRFERFEPWPDIYDFPNYIFENYNKYTAICPSCGSMDRERLYKLYIERETNLQHSHSKVLHVAPESQLRKWLQSFANITYVCGDLYPSDDLMEKIDITDIKNYSDESFDVIICSHVLEHIPDDLRAMSELYRVLKKGGWGIIQVPIALNLKETFEDPSITTPEERLRVFGQADHVRIYAKDYVDRLKSVGFKVKKFNYAQKYGLSEARKYGLSDTDVLYVVEK